MNVKPRTVTRIVIPDHRESIIADMHKAMNDRVNQILGETQVDPAIYLMTISYTKIPDAYGDVAKQINLCRRRADKFYTNLIDKLVPRNQGKNKRYQPLVFDFLDFPGTRQNKPRYSETPHCHSLVVVHPRYMDKFEDLAAQGFKMNKLSFVQDIHVERIGRTNPSQRSKKAIYRTLNISKNTTTSFAYDILPCEHWEMQDEMETVMSYASKLYFDVRLERMIRDEHSKIFFMNGEVMDKNDHK